MNQAIITAKPSPIPPRLLLDGRTLSNRAIMEQVKNEARPRLLTRRVFLGTAGALCLGTVGSYYYATRIEPHWLRVNRRPLAITNLPAALHGATMLHLSDLHVGPIVDGEYLVRAFETAAELTPDMVVITGDLTDHLPINQFSDLTGLLGRLGSPPLGIHVVLGNHDYGPGWFDVGLADVLAEKLRGEGVTVLRNESLDIQGLKVIGIDDHWSPNSKPLKALSVYTPETPTIVLCHNPDVCDLDVWGDYTGWILAGHTHGGQCRPPFLPPPLLPVRNRRYTRGDFDLDNGRCLHISTGVGYIRRARFNVRPEMTLFTMKG